MEETKRLLVVDDNHTIMKVLEKLLTAEGYKVFTASNGKDGLDVANTVMPDLIISDIDMPVMDGGEMASRLKASGRTSQIPIIFLTALISKGEGGPQSSGDNLYVSKMCKPTELLSVVRNRLAACSK